MNNYIEIKRENFGRSLAYNVIRALVLGLVVGVLWYFEIVSKDTAGTLLVFVTGYYFGLGFELAKMKRRTFKRS